MNTNKKVAILLCTFNGCKYIEEQLQSILIQTHKNWVIHISDDGSTDGTLEIINVFTKKCDVGQVTVYAGPRKGFAQNFISLLSKDIDADYFAFCDQDDIWHRNKLEVGLRNILQQAADIPILYCGRTRLVDALGCFLGYSPHFTKKASFKNALVQSIAGGNTMIINRPLKKIVNSNACNANLVSHDWTLYQIAAGCGCVIIYDMTPYIDYRQHGNNLIGSNTDIKSKIHRFKMLLNDDFKRFSETNIKLLEHFKMEFTKENLSTFERFKEMRNTSLLKRILIFMRLGLYRQTFWGNCGLLFAIIFKKI